MAISPQMVGAGLGAASSLFGGGGGDVEFRPMNVSGPLSSATFGKGGMQLGLTPEMQALMQQMFGGAAAGIGGLSDPSQVAGDYFQSAMGLLRPEQSRARSGLESRLFAQGRLGGTGGIGQFGELLGQQERARTGLAMESLFRGTQQRGQELGQAMQLFGGGMRIGQSPLEAARLGLMGGQGRLQADMANLQYGGADPMQTALLSAGQAFGGMSGWGGGSVAPSAGGAIAPSFSGLAPSTGFFNAPLPGLGG